MPWHARLGYLVAALLAFRLVWGFVGGHWSRFSTFTVHPSKVVAYLRGGHANGAGHSPIGSLSVLAMLTLLALQVGSGLFSEDSADFAGPLNRFVSTGAAKSFTLYHKDFGRWLVLALVGLHVAAIVFYKWRRHIGLTAAMVHGDKHVDPSFAQSRDDGKSRLTAALIFAIAAAAVTGLVIAAG